MIQRLLLIIAVCSALSACANTSGARMGLLTTTMPVVALVSNEVYTGDAVSYIDGTGKMRLKAETDPQRECQGAFRYETGNFGKGKLQCADGSTAVFHFHAMSTLTGYGYGKADRGHVRFTYGLTPDQAAPYLRLPAGKKLQRKDSALLLTDA
jgi:hypothetical protein